MAIPENLHQNSEIEKKVQKILLNKLMAQLPLILILSLVIAYVISYILFNAAQSSNIFIWAGVITITAALRYYSILLYRKKSINLIKIKGYIYFTALLSGMSWAGLIYFYHASDPIHIQLLILTILVGIPVATLSTNSYLILSQIAIATPILAVLNSWPIIHGQDDQISFLIITITFTILLYTTSYRYYSSLKSSVQSELETEKLLNELEVSHDRLEALAYIDPLTNLYNRRYFTTSVELAIEKVFQKKAQLYFLLIDVDEFKQINDSYGHATGDFLLTHIASVLNQSAQSFNQNIYFEEGEQAEAARLGGDEFIISYLVLNPEFSIQQTANQLIAEINQPIEFNGITLTPKASIGISESPKQADDVSNLLRLADKAMYQAKKRGGNQVFYCVAKLAIA